jgi:hypothetical protein
MQWYVDNPEQIRAQQEAARAYAVEKLDWSHNSSSILSECVTVDKRAASDPCLRDRLKWHLRGWYRYGRLLLLVLGGKMLLLAVRVYGRLRIGRGRRRVADRSRAHGLGMSPKTNEVQDDKLSGGKDG